MEKSKKGGANNKCIDTFFERWTSKFTLVAMIAPAKMSIILAQL
jgi:hypothetical protein